MKVSCPSGWSWLDSVTEMLRSDLISLLLTPFSEAKSWKPGSFPSSLCPNAAQLSMAVQWQVQPTDTWPLSTAPAVDDLPHRFRSSRIQVVLAARGAFLHVRAHPCASCGWFLCPPRSLTQRTGVGFPSEVLDPLGLLKLCRRWGQESH